MPSNSFYVVLPSNTSVDGNRTNSFRVRLPRKLQFNSEWEVGLAVIVYPHSWPSIGTIEEQFVQIDWKTGNTVRISVPPSNVTNPYELSKNLYKLLGEGSEPLAQKVRTAQIAHTSSTSVASKWARQEYINRRTTREKRSVLGQEEQLQKDLDTLIAFYGVDEEVVEREKRATTSRIPTKRAGDTAESYQKKLDEYFTSLKGADLKLLDELERIKLNEEISRMHKDDRAILDATKEMGMEAWIQAYRKVTNACQFVFDTFKNRFSLTFDPRYVKSVKISSQLSYILGFTTPEFVNEKNEARFMPDMSGGVSSFHVYAPDLIEPMMIGDVTAPVLRIVTIRGKPDENVEEQFLAIQYHKLLLKEIAELFIEIRTNSGSLMPFQYEASPELLLQFGGYNVFRGIPYQRGGGVGSVFRSLMRYLLPIGKQIGAAIGRQGLESGNRALTNVLEGKDIKESLITESKSGLANLLEKAASNLNAQKGQGFDFKRYRKDAATGQFGKGRGKNINKLQSTIGPPVGIGQTFVQQLKVNVGNTEVYDSGNLYPFKAYITNELSFPSNAKKHFLGSIGYRHSKTHNNENDEGFKERCKIFQGGKKAQFLSRVDFDLGNQELYLLNNLDLLFTIYKAKDSFLLQTLLGNDTNKYRLAVHDVKIYAKMIEVQPSFNMSLYKSLEKQPATYAVRKTEIKSSYISAGRYEFEYNVFSATIPRRMTIAMVENAAFNGDYKTTPFKFEPFDVREISVHAEHL
uniref:Uncharacterized protein n=1 Tax=Globodera rostochiensis TaxID=31243 RepID=A0A914HIK0_GLORO